jgi:hypothetical protein
MGHVGLQGQRCSILGPEHGKRTDDASGTQELRHLGRSQSDRHLLRHGLRGYEGAYLELSYLEMKSRVAREEEFNALLVYGYLHSGKYGALCGKERTSARYHQGQEGNVTDIAKRLQ